MGIEEHPAVCKHSDMNDVLTSEQRDMLLKIIENPPRCSKLDIARRAGVDLRVLVENFCLTPTQRARKMEARLNRMLERARRKHLLRNARKNKFEPLT
jgi:hypothetical protein